MIDIKKVSTNHWLLHKGQKVFHAYASGNQGEKSVCELNLPITTLKDMGLPGDRSPCCIHCFQGLYGFDLSKGLKEPS